MPGLMAARENERIVVGVPFRTLAEERAGRAPVRYLRAVEAAGGAARVLSLGWPREKLAELARGLDAVVMPGSPADVDPAWYHAARGPRTADSDLHREQADFTLLDLAFTEGKPVLAVCYGMQSLNVWLGGTLVQDIAGEVERPLEHHWESASGRPEPRHPVWIEAGSRLAKLTGAGEAQVNSSHHQAVAWPGRDLRIVARAPDGVAEAVELADGEPWVLGVQWHPERMPGDALSRALFGALVAAARRLRH
jgi:putative glutamine amidotransferase